jgi:outer membrane protein assembly factor BamA
LLILALLAGPALTQDSAAAMQLYNKGVKLLEEGKGEDARKAFHSILASYPKSAYATLAKEGLDKPLVASVEFVDIKPLSEKEVKKQFELANASMIAGHVYTSESGDQARQMLAQMMLKRKMKAKDITVTAKDLPDKKVAVTITVVH